MIIGAGRLFPVSSPPITDGGCLLKGGRIREVAPFESLRRTYPSEKHRWYGDCVLLPGLVNAHTHLEYSVFSHLAVKTPFLPWIRNLVSHARTRDLFWGRSYWEKAARIGIGRSLEAGITCVGDIVTYGGSPAAAAGSRIRMRAFLEAVALEASNLQAGIGRLRKLLDDGRLWRGSVAPGLSPHSIYTLSPEALLAVSRLSSEYGLPLTIHLSETVNEEELLAGVGPLAGQIPRFALPFGSPGHSFAGYLEKCGILSPSTLLVHGVHLTEADLKVLARHGASMATCPRSNLILGDRLPDYRLWTRCGLPFSYGTDSLASVPSFDLFQEARAVGSRLFESADSVLRRLTLGGAELLGFGEVTGSVEAGKFADLLLLRLEGARDCTAEDLVEKAEAGRVAATMVEGRFQYRARRAGSDPS